MYGRVSKPYILANRPFAPTLLRRTYAGIKQDDPSLHPTGANSEAAKSKGPLGNSQPKSDSTSTDQSNKTNGAGTESNRVVQNQKQRQQKTTPQQSNVQQSQMYTPADELQRRKTVAEMDEELRLRMSGRAGDGGEAGIEYEDGQPVAIRAICTNRPTFHRQKTTVHSSKGLQITQSTTLFFGLKSYISHRVAATEWQKKTCGHEACLTQRRRHCSRPSCNDCGTCRPLFNSHCRALNRRHYARPPHFTMTIVHPLLTLRSPLNDLTIPVPRSDWHGQTMALNLMLSKAASCK
jgi:hypothetical protein